MIARCCLTALVLVAALAWLRAPAAAQFFPPPPPTPAPSPSPTPPPGSVRVAADANLTFISQNTNGFGKLGLPEAPMFIAGTSPAQTPELPTGHSGSAPAAQSLRSWRTETASAFGAQTAQRAPAPPGSKCAPRWS